MSAKWRLTRLAGEFCVTWDDTGSDGLPVRRRFRLGTSDKAEATRRAPARFAELTRPRGSTVADIWAAYLIDKEGRAITGTMEYTWRALKARFAAIDGQAVTIADCRAHIKERRASGIQDGTIHTELGHLRTVLLWGEKHRMIDRAPAIERPSKPDPKDRHLTRQEVAAIEQAAHVPHIALAVKLMIGTGARITAALQLTWDRVNFEKGIVDLRNPFDPVQRKKRAQVPINAGLLEALREAKEGATTAYVIEWAGGPVKSIKRGLAAAAKAAGVEDVSPHVFRHSAAVWLAEAGHPMSEIAQFLGHSDSRITERVYARYSPGHLRRLADDLET